VVGCGRDANRRQGFIPYPLRITGHIKGVKVSQTRIKKPKSAKKIEHAMLTEEDIKAVTSPALQKLLDAVYEYVNLYQDAGGDLAVSLSVVAYDDEYRVVEERIALHGVKKMLEDQVEELGKMLGGEKDDYLSFEHLRYDGGEDHQYHKRFVAVLEEVEALKAVTA
jgi:hypothetical protein